MKNFFRRKFSFVLTGILMTSICGTAIIYLTGNTMDTEDATEIYRITNEEPRIELDQEVRKSAIKVSQEFGVCEKRMGYVRLTEQNESDTSNEPASHSGSDFGVVLLQTAYSLSLNGTLYLSLHMHKKKYCRVYRSRYTKIILFH